MAVMMRNVRRICNVLLIDEFVYIVVEMLEF